MPQYGSAGTVKGDPRWITARYPAVCKCGTTIPKGWTRAWYWPSTRTVECEACGEASERRFVAECQDEIMGGGWG